MEDLVEVSQGSADDVRWTILASLSPDGELLSMVRRRRGRTEATSGMAGPALPPGQLVNSWFGQASGLPPFVLVRTAPSVSGVIAVLASGARIELHLSEVTAQFGLRFAAAPLPEDDPLVNLISEVADEPE